ncbi:sigma-70 family RNA polymerase sigma factor [Verrucomicrobiaceae bacterium 227]
MASPPPQPSSRESFSALAREHHHMALLYSRTIANDEHTARDLAQEAFLSAWRNWSRFDITRDFASWLRGIIRNKWREHCRKNSRTSAWDEEALSELESTLQTMPQTGFFDHLKDCLDKLPKTLLGPVLAHYYQELSTAETAEQLQTSEPATRKRLQRARQALKTCLTQSQNTSHS